MEQQLAQRQGIWPAGPAPIVSDPYFEYTTLLLPGNGTNGAQNNTFLDGSTNNFTITRNGNTTQGTFSPFSQTGWGNYFNGSSYLSLASNANLALGTSSFTVEAFFYLTSSTTNQTIFSPNGANNGLAVNISTATTIIVDQYGSGGLSYTVPTIALNTWNHIAVVRDVSTSTTRVYLNGTESSSGGKSDAKNYTGQSTLIGTFSLVAGYYLTGYISNLRVVKGVAVYTGNFTVPTSPLTATQSAGTNIAAITGTQTSLLTCQSNRFVDNSTNNIVITPTNSPSVQAFSPFNPSASWSAATYGGSGDFDGSGEYLSAARHCF
jgi:hypothetical protein